LRSNPVLLNDAVFVTDACNTRLLSAAISIVSPLLIE
jgi:hypothetical protein